MTSFHSMVIIPLFQDLRIAFDVFFRCFGIDSFVGQKVLLFLDNQNSVRLDLD